MQAHYQHSQCVDQSFRGIWAQITREQRTIRQ